MMGGVRNWLMGMVAGRRVAYWIADDAQSKIQELGSLGGGAAICIVNVLKRTGADVASYELDGYTLTVTKTGEKQ